MNAKPALVRPRFASNLDPQVALWVTRLSIGIPTAIHQLNNGSFAEDVRQIIGITPEDDKLSKNQLMPLLKVRVVDLAERLPRRKTILKRNVEMLGALLGLNALEMEILAFAAMSQQHQLMESFIGNIRTTSGDAISKLLSVALGASGADIKYAMRPDGQLRATRIITFESGYSNNLRLELPHSLRTALFSTADNVQMLMSSFIEKAPRPNLKEDAFEHLNQVTELLKPYLAGARSSCARGINILLYGPPGTGKTEYARWLSSQMGKLLYQVRAMDDEGNPAKGIERLTFFQLSQAFLEKTDALILFDEIEDVFPGGGSLLDMIFSSRKPVAGKMFFNRLLETNPVPAIWIANEVGHIDKAYLRRFDFSFEMGIPPVAVRRGILHHYLREHSISDETISNLSQQEQLSPAQVEKAAKILKLTDDKPENREATLSLVVDNSMALLQQDKIDPILNLAECSYQLDYLNPDCDLTQLVAQLKSAPKSAGALCFYGAPGTGKTALAHYIAREIEVPLLARRASDILSPYVGETEQKIAAMFKQAKQDGALLLLDEADSFLTERKSAKHSWEITAVNEMLTQMERHNGLFICSTNLMQRLDEASLRRFALKIRFDYLKPEQRWRLFYAHAKKLPRSKETKYRAALNQLNNLTPGDFATVRRQAALLGVTLTAEDLLNRLRQECKSKRGGEGRQIGFIHSP